MATILCVPSAVTTVAAATSEAIPARIPGHWRLTTIADSIGMRSVETCIAAGDSVVVGLGDKACGRADVKRVGKEVYVDIVCKSDGGTERRSTVLTGDFTAWYRAMSKITYDPPQGGMDHVGVTVDGKYIGPSCDDLHAPAGTPVK